ncbi:MAG: rod shape-determining protein RodA [Chlamydiae bacterium]|nr:rod shape-determining protein RodA [Chlamydiota bacterium]
MWEHKYLNRIDWRIYPIVFGLMAISLLVVSSMTLEGVDFLSDYVRRQIQWFVIGWVVFFFFAGFDYRKFYEWTWAVYVVMCILLLGLFLVPAIQNVHRWYRLPFGMSFQPSEYAKLIVVMSLGWFFEKKGRDISSLFSSTQLLLIVGVPFLLILKQPDLGTALVLYPITLVMSYYGGVHKKIFFSLCCFGLIMLVFVALMFTGILSHEKMKPFFTTFLKEYQYERLNPNTYHQKAAQIAIAIGGVNGSGWHKSEFSSHKWLPAAHTDSVFAAYAEEFGLMGVILLLFLFYVLIYVSFQAVASAKESYGRLIASGVAVYLAMHMIINMAMMIGFLPITGVPLVFVTYGGSSTLTAMASLGILQSVYSRRFMF